jgi:hypothetical protein
MKNQNFNKFFEVEFDEKSNGANRLSIQNNHKKL